MDKAPVYFKLDKPMPGLLQLTDEEIRDAYHAFYTAKIREIFERIETHKTKTFEEGSISASYTGNPSVYVWNEEDWQQLKKEMGVD